MDSEKDYVIYFVKNGIKWYYTECYFKPFMPGLINAFLYHNRESVENAHIVFKKDKVVLIEEV
jgi:hypothetical protein